MRRRPWPEAVLVAGVAFSLYLQTTVPGEVFTVGDAGLKFLMTRQLARGELALDLRLPAEDWARRLWTEEALYPFAPPNVYAAGGRHYIAYPLPFLAASAPFYGLLGWRGLQALPLLACWALWGTFLLLCRRWGLSAAATAAALCLLAFSSPVTFYSATFWEHAPAVALAFGGFALLFAGPAEAPTGRACAGGILVGAAAWLREETLLLVGILLALWALPRWLPAPWRASLPRVPAAAAAGLLLSCAALFAANAVAYGHPLGLHSVSALQTFTWKSVWGAGGASFRFLLGSLFSHFPPIAACVPALAVAWPFPRERARAAFLLGLSAALVVAVPFLLRNTGGRQWGPRFLLTAIPLLCLLLALGLDAAARRSRRWAAGAWAALLPLTAWGIQVNSKEASQYLRKNYAARMVPYAFVREAGVRHVAVAQEMVAQQLAGLMDEKTFFRTERGKDLRALARELSLRGEPRFLFLCYAHYGCGPFKDLPDRYTFYTGDGRPLVQFTRRGDLDRYTVYEAALTERK
jgi:hypothetical protein